MFDNGLWCLIMLNGGFRDIYNHLQVATGKNSGQEWPIAVDG